MQVLACKHPRAPSTLVSLSRCWLAPSPGVNCVCSLEVNWCGIGELFTVGLPRNQTPPFVLTPFQLTRIMDGWKDTEDEITAASPPCMPGKDLTHHYLPPPPALHLFSPLRLHPPYSVCSCCLPEQERWMEDPDLCKLCSSILIANEKPSIRLLFLRCFIWHE